ncbi:alkaline phosphatase family protein [Bradyrhizobium sp. dw_78]|uniref:alkaline phosphatase family protein n=1 Tax=Bradyrhizobium sp. dw_78 TaxID=2719793 RepID=UPI001BD1F788|nr:alkaline phosphatase family protein [Bradyrhizobium sp. dw_78]
MNLLNLGRRQNWQLTTTLCTSVLTGSLLCIAPAAMGGAVDSVAAVNTATPIKRVIILVGENRGFDHTFATYTPKGQGQTISNLLSKGIVNADGSPGPNYSLAQQYSVAPQPTYYFGAPNIAKTPYNNSSNPMPQPTTGGAPSGPNAFYPYGVGYSAPFYGPDQDSNWNLEAQLVSSEDPDIKASQFNLLSEGATNLPQGVLDTRIPGAGSLSGPFPLQGPNISEHDYAGDMTHRFFQAAQQQDCSMENATAANPTGCLNDLFPFTELATDQTWALGNPMGFFNMAQGQVPYFKSLADRFTLSDNFHQSFLGGTYPNHMMLVTGDALYWTDGKGNATTPDPSLVANPNPQSKPTDAFAINNFISDQNLVNCADTTQPGVAPIVNYLTSLPYRVKSNCEAGHYYLMNNSNPGYNANGTLSGSVPPSPLRSIGDELNEHNLTWAWFGAGLKDAAAAADLNEQPYTDPAHAWGQVYCAICNPFQYLSSVMSDPAQRAAHMKDTRDLITGIQTNTLPSVSFGKPDGYLDGHPQSSKIDLFEVYVQNILAELQKNPRMLAETAVFITWDEAGAEYDSGFVQPIDFFGDGSRIPLLILSPYSAGGIVHHAYGDHVSLMKFIERNWYMTPVTNRSRDNLPNPVSTPANPYVPTNMPAIDDLFDAFNFNVPPTVPNYLP